MQHKRIWLVILLLLIHLHVIAGGSISIKKLNTLQPVVSITLSATEMSRLHTATLDNAHDFLSVHMVINGKAADVPLAGRYKLYDNSLSFTPMQTLGYDILFEALYKNNDGTPAHKIFRTPGHPLSEVQATVVTAYPLADTIPYNTLFFHVRFSHAMMNDKDAYKYVSMYDEKGEERKNAWRQRSFWLDDGKLLVLMIHPGRVKNGIHYESPMFNLHKTYTLKVNKEIKDINGNPLAADYEQKYYVNREDRESPSVDFSKVVIPAHGTTATLTITFSEGMDNASVLAGVKIINEQKQEVSCMIRESATDNQYIITPATPWQKGSYTLLLSGKVYDFAANRLNRLFEITDAKEMAKDEVETIWRFEIH